MNEHDLHCKDIVEELEKYASGDYFIYNGELYPLDQDDELWSREGYSYYLHDDGYYYYEIDGELIYDGDIEVASLWDYFQRDIYNTNYILDSNKNLEAVRVMIACGGPNIFINTWDKRVELHWWSENGEYWMTSELCDAINGVFADLYWEA